MFIRKVRTASGATAVQLAQYEAPGRQRIVKHLGSARDDAELGVLLEQARRLLADQDQGVLDLGIEPSTPVASMVAAPTEPALLPAPSAGVKPELGRDGPARRRY